MIYYSELQCLVNNKAANLFIYQYKIEFNYHYDQLIIYLKDIKSIRKKSNKIIEISGDEIFILNINDNNLFNTTYNVCLTLWKSYIFRALEIYELKSGTDEKESSVLQKVDYTLSIDKVLELYDIYQLNSSFNCIIDKIYFKCRSTIKNVGIKLYSEGRIYVTKDKIFFMSHENGKLYHICIPFYRIGSIDLETGVETRIILKGKQSTFILAGEKKQMLAVYAHCLDKKWPPDSYKEEYNLINSNYKSGKESYFSFSSLRSDFFYITQDSMIFIKSQKLYDHIEREISDFQRTLLWQLLSHSLYQKYYMEQNNYYMNSLEKSKYLDANILDMIEKDLYRSLPDNPKFQEEFMINSLRNVLMAYAAHNEKIGYCQSMNIICAILLLYMDEVSAFYTMMAICERMMAQCYSLNVSGAIIHQKTFSRILKAELPHIHKKLKDINLPIKVIVVSWFMCLFIDCFEDSIFLKILDLFFLKGPCILHSTAIALLSLMEDEIMQSNDIFKITSLIKGEIKIPLDGLITQMQKFPLHDFDYYYTYEAMRYIQSLNS